MTQPITTTSQPWSIPGADDLPIFGNTHTPPPGTSPRGVLLICHGFKGYKDYGFLPALAELACRSGLVAHRFNFSHSGVTQNHERFERPDLFELDTWGKQIHDLHAVAHASVHGRLPSQQAQSLPVVWFGHSRGGVTTLLAASRLFAGHNALDLPTPAGVIAAASPHHSCSLDPSSVGRLRRRGFIESPSSRTGQVLRIGKGWLDELEQDPEAYDPMMAASQLGCPVLFVHGDDDKTVPVAAAGHLARAAGKNATLEIIPNASHTFNAPNPMEPGQTCDPATSQMLDVACSFAVGCCDAHRP